MGQIAPKNQHVTGAKPTAQGPFVKESREQGHPLRPRDDTLHQIPASVPNTLHTLLLSLSHLRPFSRRQWDNPTFLRTTGLIPLRPPTRHPPPPSPPPGPRPATRAPGAASPAPAPTTASCPCRHLLRHRHSQRPTQRHRRDPRTHEATQRPTRWRGWTARGTTIAASPGAAGRRVAGAASQAVEVAASPTGVGAVSLTVRGAAFRIVEGAAVAIWRVLVVHHGELVASARDRRSSCGGSLKEMAPWDEMRRLSWCTEMMWIYGLAG